MEEENSVFFWEDPDIDLNLRHYSGSPSDVIKKIQTEIKKYLSNPNLQEVRSETIYVTEKVNGEKVTVQKDITYNVREVYSAVFHALSYYKSVSYLPAPEYGTGETFLSNVISSLNEDCQYLVSKYDPDCTDPSQSKVIQASGRIKSLLSFVNKVRQKVSEYIVEDRDLGYFNESLRDIIGVRIIIDPPAEIKAQGPEAESKFIYTVFYDLVQKRGILNPDQSNLEAGQFKFLDVNTRYNQSKSENLKTKEKPKSFPEFIDEGRKIIVYVPEERIPEVDDPRVDSKFKDKIQNPNKNGYQSLHMCVVPYFSADVEQLVYPAYILPPKSAESLDHAFEYQFRSYDQHRYAEYGPASHNIDYKPPGTYHRLAVPHYIEYDSPNDKTESSYDPDSKTLTLPIGYINLLNLKNFGESFKTFYGYSFESAFGIPFKKFRDIFSSQDRDAILAKTKTVKYDPTKDIYTAEDIPSDAHIPVFLTQDGVAQLQQIIASNDSNGLLDFFNQHFLTDSIVNPQEITDSSNLPKTSQSIPKFKIYVLSDSASRQQEKGSQTLKTDKDPSEDLESDFIPENGHASEQVQVGVGDQRTIDDD